MDEYLQKNLAQICRQANISTKYVLYPVRKWCVQKDLTWVKNWGKLKKDVCYVGEQNKIFDRFSGLVGIFLKNYIDAKLMFPTQITDVSFSDQHLTNTVLFTPQIMRRHFSKLIIQEKWNVLLTHRKSHNLFHIFHFFDFTKQEVKMKFPSLIDCIWIEK